MIRRAFWIAATPIRISIRLIGRHVMPFDYPFAGGDDE
ncbi:hypothetical protein PP505_gp54 [Gordonia phage Dorito]|uniref:Uncharacterized protein n=1 Tax=Gordonia phage Dorito TaxID=2499023 RepID=A0A3S9UAL8_9CAUD|nr:hypothetical protein PP505_gp54 [Gordonia phage Dorito]AZS07324.1 hypothetical protein PBI_DORITO_54 [Gordonia phage Dorito]